MKNIRFILERFGGVAVSIAMHVILIAVLVNTVVLKSREAEREIEVQMVDVNESPETEPQKFAELPRDENPVETDRSEALPDTPADDFSTDTMDLSGLTMSAVDSPLVMKGLFAGRTAEARSDRLRQFAGGYGEQVEAAVLRALRWLASQQNEAGCWGESAKKNKTWHTRKWTAAFENEQRITRLTSLCLLAFLAHGETPQSAEFGTVVQSAIEYLMEQQNPETGLFVPIASTQSEKGGEDLGVYAHAQATYALAEAYALTCAPALKRPVENGLQVIINGQLTNGAWGNWYRQEIADSSATSWQIQALTAASAAGIQLDGMDAAMKKAVEGVSYLYVGDGSWYYRKGVPLKMWSNGGPIMSGAMVLSLQLLGSQNDPLVLAGLRYMNEFGVTEWEKAWTNPINKSLPATYEWYYNTQAVFQRGGSRWKTWNEAFAPMLIGNQHLEGWWRGPGQKEGEETIYSTSLCALSLQVYYRILPSFQQAEKKAPKVTFDDDIVITIL